MAPSPKYWSCSKTGRNRKGMERLAIKWSKVSCTRAPLRNTRAQGSIGGGGGVKSHRIRIGVARGADADRLQMLLVQAARDAVEVQLLAQQIPQRRVVEQRMRRMHQPAAGDERQHPVQSGPQHAGGVRLEHLVHAKIAPHSFDGIHRAPEVRRVRGERDGADGAGGGPGDDGKRTRGTAPQQFRDALEHADLVGGARAAARQHQAQVRARRRARRWYACATARWGFRDLHYSECSMSKHLGVNTDRSRPHCTAPASSTRRGSWPRGDCVRPIRYFLANRLDVRFRAQFACDRQPHQSRLPEHHGGRVDLRGVEELAVQRLLALTDGHYGKRLGSSGSMDTSTGGLTESAGFGVPFGAAFSIRPSSRRS